MENRERKQVSAQLEAVTLALKDFTHNLPIRLPVGNNPLHSFAQATDLAQGKLEGGTSGSSGEKQGAINVEEYESHRRILASMGGRELMCH